jgi:hypothetical protein
MLSWLQGIFKPQPLPPEPKPELPVDFSSDIKLTDQDREDLLAIVDDPGYQVVLKIMKGTCRGFTDALLNSDPADDKAVLSAHVIAQSSWLFLDSVTKQVSAQVEVAMDEQRAIEQQLKDLGRDDILPVDRPKAVWNEPATPLELMGIK